MAQGVAIVAVETRFWLYYCVFLYLCIYVYFGVFVYFHVFVDFVCVCVLFVRSRLRCWGCSCGRLTSVAAKTKPGVFSKLIFQKTNTFLNQTYDEGCSLRVTSLQ